MNSTLILELGYLVYIDIENIAFPYMGEFLQ